MVHVCESRPSTSPTQYHFCLAVLEYIVRLKLQDDGALTRHIEKASSWFVDTLAEAWRNVKADKPKDRLQIMKRLHAAKLYLVFDRPALDAVYASLDNPADVMEQVYKLVDSNCLGKSMFQETLQSVLSNRTSRLIREQVEHKVGGLNLTSDLWKTTCREILKQANAVDPSKLMRQRRQVSITYRGRQILVKCASLLQEVEFWLGAKLKEIAVAAKD